MTARILYAATAGSRPGWACFAAKEAPRPPRRSIALLGPRLEEAKKDTGFDGLKRFLAFFGNQPQAAAARAELLQRLTQAGRILEAELLMAAAVDPEY